MEHFIQLSPDIQAHIASFNMNDVYKLKSWVDETKLNIKKLNMNPNAHTYLMKNLNLIDIQELEKNPKADLLQFIKNRSKLNPHFIYHFLPYIAGVESNTIVPLLDNIIKNTVLLSFHFWRKLSGNKYALPLLLKYREHIDIDTFIFMQDDGILPILQHIKSRLEKHHWTYLSENAYAFPFLMENREKIVWKNFCKNARAFSYLTDPANDFLDKINWNSMSLNVGMTPELVQKYWHKLEGLSTTAKNPVAIDMLKNKYLNNIFIYSGELCHNPLCGKILMNIENPPEYIHRLSTEKFEELLKNDYGMEIFYHWTITHTTLMKEYFVPSKLRPYYSYLLNSKYVDIFIRIYSIPLDDYEYLSSSTYIFEKDMNIMNKMFYTYANNIISYIEKYLKENSKKRPLEYIDNSHSNKKQFC